MYTSCTDRLPAISHQCSAAVAVVPTQGAASLDLHSLAHLRATHVVCTHCTHVTRATFHKHGAAEPSLGRSLSVCPRHHAPSCRSTQGRLHVRVAVFSLVNVSRASSFIKHKCLRHTINSCECSCGFPQLTAAVMCAHVTRAPSRRSTGPLCTLKASGTWILSSLKEAPPGTMLATPS